MLPARIVLLDALPTLPNGKLDRSALPEPAPIDPGLVPTAPGTVTEATLLAVFRTVLDRDDIGVHDDFFASGGDSLGALRVSALAGADLPALSLEALFECPTVATLARRIDGATLSPIVTLNRAGAPIALFCVHPGYGLVGEYRALAGKLDGIATVHGIQSPGLSDPHWRPDSIREIARDYLDRIRAIQPAGPYHLLGWSLGGTIALEMACQLDQAGEGRGLLVLVDTLPDPVPADEEEEAMPAAADAPAALETRIDRLAATHRTLLRRHAIEPVSRDLLVWCADNDPAKWRFATTGSVRSLGRFDAEHATAMRHPGILEALTGVIAMQQPSAL